MFDYFYGNETEQYHYYSVPKLLFTDDKFKGLSCQAKLLYGFLLDRTALSVENKWFDKQGRIYVYYKQSDAQNNLNIGKNKATAIFTELENIGLIIRQRQGQGKPTKIFVMNFTKFIGKQRKSPVLYPSYHNYCSANRKYSGKNRNSNINHSACYRYKN